MKNKSTIIEESTIRKLISERKTGEEISNYLHISRKTLYNYLNKWGLNLSSNIGSRIDDSVFDVIDSDEKSYWLGFLYADGYVCSYHNQIELSLASCDSEHIYKFAKFLSEKDLDKIKISTSKKKGFSRCRYIIGSKHLKDRLISLGCIPNKSKSLKFPDINNFKNIDLIYSFIRGYVDGDGCLYEKRKSLCIEITSGSFEFLESIKYYFPEFGKISVDSRNNNNVFRITCSNTKAKSVSKKLYENSSIYLDRKFKKFAALCRNT